MEINSVISRQLGAECPLYRMCYVEDPFGLIFEVYSHSYELTYSQGAY
jgi:hypothetical protein